MSTTALGDILRYMRLTFEAQEERDVSDAALLERFRGQHDEAAFAVLAHRHGPMVLAVGRRVTGDAHAAEDVYQATFLAMARRAGSIGRNGSVGGWLYAVAQSIAARAKSKATAQRKLERRAKSMPQPEPLDGLTWQELRGVLDEELAQLPEKYRTPLILCDLEGKSHDRAAKELGWPRTSLASRLSRARELLRGQLVRRGITLSGAAVATALTEKANGAPVAAKLAVNTLKAAMSAMRGKVAAGAWISGNAIALAEEAMTGLAVGKAKLLLVVLTIVLTAGGAGLAGFGGLAERERPAKREGTQQPSTKPEQLGPEKKAAPVVTFDIDGDQLPAGAVGRLGSTRFRAGQFTSALAFAADGKTLASLGRNGQFGEGGIWLWDTATGKAKHHHSVSARDRSMAFSPEGERLLIGGDCTEIFNLRIVEVASGKVFRHLEKPNEPRLPNELAVAYSSDGLTVAAGGRDANGCRVFLWDAATGKLVRALNGNAKDGLSAVAYSPDGKTLVAAGNDNAICLWDVATGNVLRQFEGTEVGPVRGLFFVASSKVMACLGDNGTIQLWDIEIGKLLRSLKGDPATIRKMTLSPDGRVIASGGRNGVIHLWDAVTLKAIRAWQTNERDISALAFSPNGKVLASIGYTFAAIRFWDTTTGNEIDPIAGHTGVVRLLQFAPDGKTVLSCGSDAKVLEWNLRTFRDSGRLFNGSMGPTKDGWNARTLDLSLDGKMLAVVGSCWTGDSPSDDSVIRLFEVATGKEIRTWELPDRGFMRSLKFSPNGKLLVSIGQTGIRLWDVAKAKELLHLKGNSTIFPVDAFSPDGKFLLLTDAEATIGNAIRLWDIAAWQEVRRWDSGLVYIEHLLFAPDGKTVVSTAPTALARNDRVEVQVWATDTGTQYARLGYLEGNSRPRDTKISSMAFSPSGRVLAVGVNRETTKGDLTTYFCTIHLFEMLSGKEIRKIDAPQGSLLSLAFAPDGRTLAAAGTDSTILLWDLTGQAQTAASKPISMTAKDAELFWSQLGEHARVADDAIWALARAPKPSLPMLKAHLHVIPAPAEVVAKLIADLDSDQFAPRQKTAKALDDLGESVEAALRKALAANPPLEVRQRVEQILEKRGKEVIRRLRAIEVLELIGTAEAQQELQEMARAAPNPRVAEAAAAALARIGKRGSGMR